MARSRKTLSNLPAVLMDGPSQLLPSEANGVRLWRVLTTGFEWRRSMGRKGVLSAAHGISKMGI